MFLLTILVVFFSSQSYAKNCVQEMEAPDTDVICTALKDSNAYKNNKSYKMLESGHDGWVFRTNVDFKDNFELNNAELERFKRLKQAFEYKNIELAIALLPTRGMMHHSMVADCEYDYMLALKSYNKLAEQLRNIGISVATVPVENYNENFYYKRDHHWRAFGAKIMAKQVAKEIKKLPVYNDINKSEFVTELVGEDVHKGSFVKFINKKCSSDIKGEDIKLYQTSVKSDENDLFAENKIPEIVLIGTSNSTQRASQANFDGFLKEYVGADIDNQSVSGGGADTSFFQWLNSDEYNVNKPKIVIWEVPVYQNFNSEQFFRQLIPSIYGDCFGSEISVENIDADKTINLFSDVFDKQNINNNFYLKLTFCDKNLKKMRVVTTYENGDRDVRGLSHSKYYNGDGVFFYEFDHKINKNIKRFSLTIPENINGNIKAELCAYPSL